MRWNPYRIADRLLRRNRCRQEYRGPQLELPCRETSPHGTAPARPHARRDRILGARVPRRLRRRDSPTRCREKKFYERLNELYAMRMKLTESRSFPAHLASRSAKGLAATASSSVTPLPTMA